MWFSSSLPHKPASNRTRLDRSQAAARRLTVETLEERQVLSFLAPVQYPNSGGGGIGTGDFNNDGLADLASTHVSGGRGEGVMVHLGNGDGTFRTPRITSYSRSGYAGHGDFNSDGRLDAVITGYNGLSIMLGNGDGTFRQPLNFTAPPKGHYSGGVATGDMNNDGKLDVVWGSYEIVCTRTRTPLGWLTVCRNEWYLNVLLGNGDGSLQATKKNTQVTVYAGAKIVLADFNRDAKLDVLAGPALLLGQGNGSLGQPSVVFEGGSSAAADFNGDGLLDIVSISSTSVGLYLGNGDGTFQPPRTFAGGNSPVDVAIADVNRDGLLDVVTSNYQAGTVSVLVANGPGSFQAARDYSAGPEFPQGLVAEDFNRDGYPDLAVIGGGSLWILKNNGNW